MDLAMHYCGGCGSWVHCFFTRNKYLCRRCAEDRKEEEKMRQAVKEGMSELHEFLKG